MVVAPPRSKALELFLTTEHIVGQERARRQLAVLLDRQLRVAEGEFPAAAGAILAGPTGVGKTATARAMCAACGLPFAETTATRYTEAGYAGLDLQQMFLPLIESAAVMIDARQEATAYQHSTPQSDRSVLKRPDIAEVVKLAETGVVLLDEFDKWMLRVNHVTGQQDKAIQADLLKMVEGSIQYVSDEEDEVGIPFDSSRVLILCAGAFVNLTRAAMRRLEKDEDALSGESFWDLIEPGDFEKFGLIPELVGRLSTYIFMKALTKDQLAEILMLPDSPLQEYRRRFADLGCGWEVEQAGVGHLAKVALDQHTGARGVDRALWAAFGEALFEASVAEHDVSVHYEVNWPKARVR